MAAQWITNGIANGIASSLSGTVSTAVSTAGGYAGNAASSVGSGINGVGRTIENSVRGYGDGVINYGNAIKDWTGASGPRSSTAANPLGLSDNAGGGKRSLTSAPAKNFTLPSSKSSTQKALPAPTASKNASTGPKPAAQVSKPRPNLTPSTNPGSTSKGQSTYAGSVAGSVAPSVRSTASKRADLHKRVPARGRGAAGAVGGVAGKVAASAPKPRTSYQVPSGAAANPLGLSGKW